MVLEGASVCSFRSFLRLKRLSHSASPDTFVTYTHEGKMASAVKVATCEKDAHIWWMIDSRWASKSHPA